MHAGYMLGLRNLIAGLGVSSVTEQLYDLGQAFNVPLPLDFLPCKMGIMREPTSKGCCLC